MPITVYNRSHEDHTEDPNNYLIMRPSILGNPFTHKRLDNTMAVYRVRSREEAVKRYSSWFDLKYSSDRTFRSFVDGIYEKYKAGEQIYFECCCKPKECHGDVIASKLKARLLKDMVSGSTEDTGEKCH